MPSQFKGQVLEENGKPLNRLNVEIDYPGRVGERIYTITNINGEWEITLDDSPDPKDVTVRFYKDGYETKIVINPQPTEILKGFIDPIKGGTLDLTGKYKDGKYEFNSFSVETQGLIIQEAQDIYQFAIHNYGNYTITVDATETPTEKEDINIQYQLPGLLAEARMEELQKVFENELSKIYNNKLLSSGGRYVIHNPKVELGNIDVVENIKPGAKIKVNFIILPITNIPVPNSEEEFIQFLINNGFEKLTTQEAIDKASVYPGNYPLQYLEYFYYDQKEERFAVKYKSVPNKPELKNLIILGRFNLIIQLDGSIYSSPKYSFYFDSTQSKYTELQPNLQKWINDNFINLSTKENIRTVDKETIIGVIKNIATISYNSDLSRKSTNQKVIDIDMNYVKRHIENDMDEADKRELYNLLSKQRDIILANGFAVNIIF